jgi:hypothetical protein
LLADWLSCARYKDFLSLFFQIPEECFDRVSFTSWQSSRLTEPKVFFFEVGQGLVKSARQGLLDIVVEHAAAEVGLERDDDPMQYGLKTVNEELWQKNKERWQGGLAALYARVNLSGAEIMRYGRLVEQLEDLLNSNA